MSKHEIEIGIPVPPRSGPPGRSGSDDSRRAIVESLHLGQSYWFVDAKTKNISSVLYQLAKKHAGRKFTAANVTKSNKAPADAGDEALGVRVWRIA